MSTVKIREALERMEREARAQHEWGTANLAVAARGELETIEAAARVLSRCAVGFPEEGITSLELRRARHTLRAVATSAATLDHAHE